MRLGVPAVSSPIGRAGSSNQSPILDDSTPLRHPMYRAGSFSAPPASAIFPERGESANKLPERAWSVKLPSQGVD